MDEQEGSNKILILTLLLAVLLAGAYLWYYYYFEPKSGCAEGNCNLNSSPESKNQTFCQSESDCQHDCGLLDCAENQEVTAECLEKECHCGCVEKSANTNTSSASDTNTAANTKLSAETNEDTSQETGVATAGSALNLLGGEVSLTCETDNDCLLVSTQKDYSECCPKPACDDYSENIWVAVNKWDFKEFQAGLQSETCMLVDCLDYEPVVCPENNNDKYEAQCFEGQCRKVYE